MTEQLLALAICGLDMWSIKQTSTKQTKAAALMPIAGRPSNPANSVIRTRPSKLLCPSWPNSTFALQTSMSGHWHHGPSRPYPQVHISALCSQYFIICLVQEPLKVMFLGLLAVCVTQTTSWLTWCWCWILSCFAGAGMAAALGSCRSFLCWAALSASLCWCTISSQYAVSGSKWPAPAIAHASTHEDEFCLSTPEVSSKSIALCLNSVLAPLCSA